MIKKFLDRIFFFIYSIIHLALYQAVPFKVDPLQPNQGIPEFCTCWKCLWKSKSLISDISLVFVTLSKVCTIEYQLEFWKQKNCAWLDLGSMESARNSCTGKVEQVLCHDGETKFQCTILQGFFVMCLSIDAAEHQCVNVNSLFVPVLQTPDLQFS